MKMEHVGNRRTFLKDTAVFGGAMLALLLGRGRAVAAPVKKNVPSGTSTSAGYQLTEHIKKYYETANL